MRRTTLRGHALRVIALSAGAAITFGSFNVRPAVAADEDSVARVGNVTSATYRESRVERTTVVEREVVVERKPKEKYKCAIFVANRAKKIDDEKVSVMEDFLTGNATDKGFEVISREAVLNSVGNLAKAGPNKGGEKGEGAKLDEALSDNTSALRLAQNMEADYVLFVTISTFGSDETEFKDPNLGVEVLGVTSKMRATYKLLDITRGGSLTAGVATATKSDRVDARTKIRRQNVVDDLLEATAMDMSSMLERAAKGGRIADPGPKNGKANFEVFCGVADMVFPEIVKNAHGEYEVTAGRYKLEQLGVTVEMDGIVIGTSPGPLSAAPGLHKVRLRREKFQDWTGTVNISDGQTLQVAMQMTPEGRAQFKDMTDFVDRIKREKILTDAEAKAWEGYAQQMRQSGNRVQVDVKKNIKYDTKSDVKSDSKSDSKKDVRQDSKDAADHKSDTDRKSDSGRKTDTDVPTREDVRKPADEDVRPSTPRIKPPTPPAPDNN